MMINDLGWSESKLPALYLFPLRPWSEKPSEPDYFCDPLHP